MMQQQQKIKNDHFFQSPPFLNKGDCIGITCPASKMAWEEVEYGERLLQSWGYQTRIGNTLIGHYHNFSATDHQRVIELQEMLDHPDIKAIIFGRGGYGMLRIIDQLNFEKFKKHPKWICGYSDITALHLHLFQNCRVQTLHSVMVGGMTSKTAENKFVQSLKQTLEGEKTGYHFDTHALNRKGTGIGQLIGGNLSLLSALCGSSSVPDMKDKILFIEDIGEYKYIIDRMMLTLKRAGWLNHLSGLIIGSFSNSKDTEEPFGQSEEELILDKVRAFNYPVAFGFPVGHQEENYTLKEGAIYELKVGEVGELKEIKL